METFLPFINEPGTATSAEEVILTFPDNLSPSTTINIQDGTYAGGGPATVEGSTLTLPTTFNTSALIVVLLNGQEIKKGTDITRVSSTQISMSVKLKTDDQIKIRIFS